MINERRSPRKELKAQERRHTTLHLPEQMRIKEKEKEKKRKRKEIK